MKTKPPKSGVTLGELGERETIRRLAARVGLRPEVTVGIGDDCAVAAVGAWDWLLTSDPVIEGVHFLKDTPGEQVGHKAAGRVLSDVAAMGGEALWLLVNLVAPPETELDRLDAIYRGATGLAARFGAVIVGGDVACGPRLELHVFAVGRVPHGRAVLRSGAQPGEVLYVTGALGGSRAGRHLAFEPRLAEGQWLAAGGWPTAMLDVSDGLASDVRRLMEQSRVGATIFEADVPITDAARTASDGRPPLEHALDDGEDFELLLTVAADRAEAFDRAWAAAWTLPCTRIGVLTEHAGRLELQRADGARSERQGGGYEHFVTDLVTEEQP